jgi:hypothetical protein
MGIKRTVGVGTGIVIAIGMLASGTFAALILVDLHGAQLPAAGGSAGATTSPIVTVRHTPAFADRGDENRPRDVRTVPPPPTTAPWEATPESSPPLPDRHIPAWQVRPPPPDPNAAARPEPTSPPDPATTRPPMDNPGGVNGDRPPRAEE